MDHGLRQKSSRVSFHCLFSSRARRTADMAKIIKIGMAMMHQKQPLNELYIKPSMKRVLDHIFPPQSLVIITLALLSSIPGY